LAGGGLVGVLFGCKGEACELGEDKAGNSRDSFGETEYSLIA
jgi:hypothetical protein